MSLERKLNANATLKVEYSPVLEECLKLGHISLKEDPDDNGYYISHHIKIRIVFDALATTNNDVSLILMIDPQFKANYFLM